MSSVSSHITERKALPERMRSQTRILSVSLVGEIGVEFGGRRVGIRGQKTRALLAYVALSDQGAETRERLVGLLWSEANGNHARGSLRQAVRFLRQAFDTAGFRGYRADNLGIAIDRAQVQVDIWAAVQDAERRRVHPLLLNTNRATDLLLDGYDDIDPAFRVWLLARRQTLHDRIIRALEGGLRDGSVDAEEQVRMAEALLNLDPTHEEACRYLMRSRALSGDTAAALRIYKTLWDLLDCDYDMEPSAKTQKLVADIKRGLFEADIPPSESPSVYESTASRTATAPALPSRTTAQTTARPARLVLVVEPFATNSIDADRLHIVDGFRHHLIACLVKFREWQVTERPPTKTGQVSGDVPARYKVEVTVYQGGPALNLILSLKEIETEHFVWSDRLQLNSGNMFELQQRIVQRITVALNIQLSTERLIRLAGQPNLSRELYDRWLLGQELGAKRRPADWERASEIFAELIREAPGFSPAYSSLAQMRNVAHIVHPGLFRTESGQRETLAIAKSAAQLDPIDSRAQLCLGWAYAFDGQFDQALLHFGLACDLNDTDPWTLVSSAHGHAFAGEFERSRVLAERAINVALVPSPVHWTYRAAMHFMWGDYRGCIEAADRSQDVAALTPMWRAAALARLGRLDDARLEGQRLLAFVRSHWRNDASWSELREGAWLAHLFPIRQESDRRRLLGALQEAGLPCAASDPVVRT